MILFLKLLPTADCTHFLTLSHIICHSLCAELFTARYDLPGTDLEPNHIEDEEINTLNRASKVANTPPVVKDKQRKTTFFKKVTLSTELALSKL